LMNSKFDINYEITVPEAQETGSNATTDIFLFTK
jgi:hypothetical protein